MAILVSALEVRFYGRPDDLARWAKVVIETTGQTPSPVQEGGEHYVEVFLTSEHQEALAPVRQSAPWSEIIEYEEGYYGITSIAGGTDV